MFKNIRTECLTAVCHHEFAVRTHVVVLSLFDSQQGRKLLFDFLMSVVMVDSFYEHCVGDVFVFEVRSVCLVFWELSHL
jgi:hypothetical protein